MPRDFDHRHSGHCETGALSALFRDRGMDISESLLFGIGGGPFFVHVPFIKMGDIPLTAYRDAPGSIIKNVCKRLKIPMQYRKFRNEKEGMDVMDEMLSSGNSVGLRTSVFYLPYFPPDMRFQFNAHHLVAFDREKDDYYISDPVFDHIVTCSHDDLLRSRFAKGTFAPKGYMFYPASLPKDPDLSGAIRKSISTMCKRMLYTPIPFIGIRGIRYLSKRVRKWPIIFGPEKALVNVGTVVRMQEEIGTGGAGFRYMYTAFLQEAAEITGIKALTEASEIMAETGDKWREFAVMGARMCKTDDHSQEAYNALSDKIMEVSKREEEIYRFLRKSV